MNFEIGFVLVVITTVAVGLLNSLTQGVDTTENRHRVQITNLEGGAKTSFFQGYAHLTKGAEIPIRGMEIRNRSNYDLVCVRWGTNTGKRSSVLVGYRDRFNASDQSITPRRGEEYAWIRKDADLILRRSNRTWQGKQFYFYAVDPNVTVYAGVITSKRGSAQGCGFAPGMHNYVEPPKRYDSVFQYLWN